LVVLVLILLSSSVSTARGGGGGGGGGGGDQHKHKQEKKHPPSLLLVGNVSAVYDLIDRVLGGSSRSHFSLRMGDADCGTPPCFCLQDVYNVSIATTTSTSTSTANGDNQTQTMQHQLQVTATTASELAAGVGYYLRQYVNLTIGWPRGGGSHVVVPNHYHWPTIRGKEERSSTPLCKRRLVPWSYLMNVCTHSYSLVWYDWLDWERFIDWMSLSGINLMLAMTGQEELQYKVFSQLGVADMDIRRWFNGPAFLTWSRGQNEYGNNIGGPLPRSWMKAQWELQRHKILPRLRSLGIVGQLPGFQGNVPIQLKALYKDTNMTQMGATGWMDSLDPLFGKIADLWMETLIEDFGTDHWYQMDGYFDGSTAPWRTAVPKKEETINDPRAKTIKAPLESLTQRATREADNNTNGEMSPYDEMALQRGVAAYAGLNRTDPNAIWSFQGWAIVDWSTPKQAAVLHGFVKSAPPNKFVVIDMSTNGEGEWKQWNNASFFGAPFVWTSLHNFGGTDGMKGDLAKLNQIPFEALDNASTTTTTTSVFGTGASPEGIDQNPAYYEFVFDQNFREAPVENITAHMITRSHRRYGLSKWNDKIAEAWSLLVDSAYSQDLSVQDYTGIPHLPARGLSLFNESDRCTPKPVLCQMFHAWRLLLEAAEEEESSSSRDHEDPSRRCFRREPFLYDLVNLGREILAQLSTPASWNFTDATSRPAGLLDPTELVTTGRFYIELLQDTDTLVATDQAFLLGPWIVSARHWGKSLQDCPSDVLVGNDCEHFFEWNARTQITTWNPVPFENSTAIPGGPIDYAGKHWSGLIRDYYGVRAELLLQQALKDEAASTSLNQTEVKRLQAGHAFRWTTATNNYPSTPVGDFLAVTRSMYDKYKHWFTSCDTTTLLEDTTGMKE
jgi:alpha-N-acetylglucosaminidase